MTIVETAAHGAVLAIELGPTAAEYTTVEGVSDGPGGGGWTTRVIEAVHHSSTVVKKKATIVDPSPITFTLLYDSSDTVHAALRDAAKNKTQKNFRITFTDTGAEVITFAAHVTSFDRSANPEDWNKISVELTPFGDFTVT